MQLTKRQTLAWMSILATGITALVCLAGDITSRATAPVVFTTPGQPQALANSEKNIADLSTYIVLHQTTSGIRAQYVANELHRSFPF